MPTTSQGIYYPDSTTNVAPLHTVFSTMASSIDTVLAGGVRVHRAANTTARNALVSQFPPSAANPLIVWRADAPNGRELEYTKNGSTWHYYSSSEDDTGWVAVSAATGFTNNAGRVRRIGNQVFYEGAFSGSFAANTTTHIATVPVGYRPSTGTNTITAGAATQGVAVYYMNVEPSGQVRARVASAGVYNVALAPLTYLLN